MDKQLTVFMPVYNRDGYLRESINTILNQTYRDFDFLIIDDGSTDSTPAILAQCASEDSRIRVLRNDVNRGVPYTRNRALAEVKTPFLAFNDSDDSSLPWRLEKQMARLAAEPDLVALGGMIVEMDKAGNVTNRYTLPLEHDEIVNGMWRHNYHFISPSTMVRVDALRAIGGYRTFFNYSEDYDLWLRLSQHGGRMANLADSIYCYRLHSGQISRGVKSILSNSLAWLSAYCRETGQADPIEGLQ